MACRPFQKANRCKGSSFRCCSSLLKPDPREHRFASIAKSHQRELVVGSDPTYTERQHENREIPPTGVGGWFRSSLFNAAYRLDLNKPPTSVGGIYLISCDRCV